MSNMNTAQSIMERSFNVILNFFGEETLVCRLDDGSIRVHFYGFKGAYAMSTTEFNDAQSAINFCEQQFAACS